MKSMPALSKVDNKKLLSKSEFCSLLALHGKSNVSDEITELSACAEKQCVGAQVWPKIKNINAWMISSETATFMKVGGLGVVATELPEAFNATYASQGDKITVVTPLYVGNTGRKKATVNKNIYTGAENNSVEIKKITDINVPFVGKNRTINKFNVGVYCAKKGPVEYIFLKNRRFFSITTDYRNPDCQDGCYVLNKLGVNEVERFAFFSKAVYVLLLNLVQNNSKLSDIDCPNVLLANDWHSGALSGLTKYRTQMLKKSGDITADDAKKLCSIPVVHLAHHLGYQGWDNKNTVRILNSLYEESVKEVLKNAKVYCSDNPRIHNTLIVDGVYNQACCNFHLADRVVTVSNNYCEEVSKEPDFGYDFCNLLNQRKKNGTFIGIVNGYDKKLITPNPKKVGVLNSHFGGFDFGCYDETSIEIKKKNKREFIRLLAKLATDKEYKQKTLPLLNFYKFDDVSDLAEISDSIPMFCATSRLVEQKGYDIVSEAIIKLYKHGLNWGWPVSEPEIPLQDAIGHLPSLESGETSDIPWHFAKVHNDRSVLALKHTPTGKSAIANEIYYPKKEDGTRIKGFHNTFKRIQWDQPCPTRTTFSGSMSSHNNVHPGRLLPDGTYSDARVLTLLETFIVSSIPETVDFPKGSTDTFIRTVIGESIPPKLMMKVIEKIGEQV